MSKVNTDTVFAGSGITFLARLRGDDGQLITQASLSGVTVDVWDRSNSDVSVLSTAVTVTTSVFDTLQTDPRWTADTTGYNFRYDMADTVLSQDNHKYRVEFWFTPVTGSKFPLVWEISTIETLK